MENIERTHFMVLTGHLDDQSLPDLIRTLRVQRKSGRLQVEYADAPGLFFFEDGQLVDAQLGSLRGLEAVYAALASQGASFNFNPLVRPPERSIDRQQQKFISDLVEAPRRDNLAEIKIAGGGLPPLTTATTAAIAASSPGAPLQLAPLPAEALAPLEQRLTAVEEAIHATSRRFSRERLIYAVIISFLVGLTAVTAVQALLNTRKPTASAATTNAADATRTGQKPGAANSMTAAAASGGEAARAPSGVPVKKDGEGVAAAAPAPAVERESAAAGASQAGAGATKNAARTPASQNNAGRATQPARDARKNGAAASTPAARGAYVVRVLMEVKDGQVTGARVLNPQPGASDYESLALRMARQRRYPKNFTGGDTWNIRVKP
ncbi:MAG TPA: DUF4388 domain-containing protein [Pyrinomonadaceae bacterium]|nr:DUF4388 domain-containing protein [Pyrinomonadaceae bacterium]